MKNINSFFNLDNFLEQMTDLVFIKNIEGQYTNCNQSFLDFIQRDRKEVINKTDFDLFSKINASQFTKIDKEILESGESRSLDEVFVLDDDNKAYFGTTKKVLYNNSGEKVGLFCVARNITKRKEYEIIYEDNKLILEFIAKENNLKKVLDKIVYLSESRSTNSKCSILMVDEKGEHLVGGSSPSLPSFYNEAINGIEIGPTVGSCGSAAFKKERVIIDNIDEHENWKPFLELTKKVNLHACWSEPIISSNNKVLGTFAIYNEHPRSPSEFELKLISSFAHLVSVAIEKDKNYKLLQEKEILILNQSKMASLGEMLENIAHQWRQPLSVISTAASGIKLQKDMSVLDENTLENSLDNILNSTKYLSTTLDSFRDYFKTSSSKEKFYISSCIDKSKNAIQSSLDEKNIIIVGDIPKIQIYQIENELIQVLLNIFKNAYDAFTNIKEDNIILITITYTDNEITILIKDTAGGIKENILTRVFEPYFTTKHKAQGTGIGLYMCKEIIEKQMSGSLTVDNTNFSYNNRDYKGAQFTIKLNR
ncbi:ATP-binding protein [Arcobacter sp. LA11]|uniref:PAS domain-containing sensor histidine kinase n=1 Tax=Arcobacter sp. LA11 TaxID=1898176 RepID=UPI000933E971|nr:ATP-binding protein [Arcobacter sp. LA11]